MPKIAYDKVLFNSYYDYKIDNPGDFILSVMFSASGPQKTGRLMTLLRRIDIDLIGGSHKKKKTEIRKKLFGKYWFTFKLQDMVAIRNAMAGEYVSGLMPNWRQTFYILEKLSKENTLIRVKKGTYLFNPDLKQKILQKVRKTNIMKYLKDIAKDLDEAERELNLDPNNTKKMERLARLRRRFSKLYSPDSQITSQIITDKDATILHENEVKWWSSQYAKIITEAKPKETTNIYGTIIIDKTKNRSFDQLSTEEKEVLAHPSVKLASQTRSIVQTIMILLDKN